MPGHRRSLSAGLILEDNDKGGVLVSGINSDLTASQGLHKGDELLGATIHFDHLKKNEVIEILKLIEPYNDKVEMLTRQGLRSAKSVGNLDYRIKAPDEILKDSYNKLFNAKVKKFIKEDTHGDTQEIETSSSNGQLIAQGLSYGNSKTDISNQPVNTLPSVDSTHSKVDVAACLQKVEHRQTLPNMQKMPKFGLSADLSKGLSLKDPTVKGDIDSPDIDLTLSKPDLEGAHLNMKSPNIDIDGPNGKLKMPKLKTPKFSIPGFKGPDVDFKGDLKGPDLNLSSPTFDADVSGPNIDIDGPNANLKGVTLPDMNLPSGKSKMPKFKMPSLGLSGPKVKTPEMDLSLPKMKGEINSPNLTGPQLNVDAPSSNIKVPTLEGPNLDIRVPEFDIDAPDGKLKMPKGPDFKLPKIKGGLDSPDMSLYFPKADMKGPNLDVKSPDLDISGPSGKLKMPKFKTPKVSLPGFKGPDIDVKGDLKGPDFNLSSPKFGSNVSVPDLDTDVPRADFKGVTIPDMNLPSGKSKMPQFKIPGVGFSGPKVKAPEGDLSIPKVTGEISSPNFTGQQLNVDAPSGNIKVPTLKGPKLDIRAPEFDIDAPNGKLKMPKGPDLKAPKIKGGFDSPDMNLALPEVNLNMPKLNVKSTDTDIDGPRGKIKVPKLKTPKFPHVTGSSVRGVVDVPNMDLNFPRPDFESPRMNMRSPNIGIESYNKPKMPTFMIPDPEDSKFKYKTPEIGVSTPMRNVDSPDYNIRGYKTNRTGPGFDAEIPAGKIKVTNGLEPEDTDAYSGKVKMPTFGLSSTLAKGPDIRSGIYSSGMNLHFPEVDMSAPNLDVDTEFPSANMNRSSSGPNKQLRYDMNNHWHRNTSNGSVKMMRDMEFFGSGMDLEVPKQSLKGSKFKLLSLV